MPSQPINITTRANVTESKLRVLYLSEGEKQGKSHCGSSFPKPMIVLSGEYNNDTIDGQIRSGSDIEIWDISYEQFQHEVVPAVKNREIKTQDGRVPASLFLDGIGMLTDNYWRGRLAGRAKLNFDDYNIGKNRFGDDFTSFVSASKVMKGKPSYHLIGSSHLADVYSNDSLVAYRPAIMGAFKNQLGKLFGTVLLCKSDLYRPPAQNNVVPAARTRHRVYAAPPSAMFALGDGVGGEGKPYNELPPILEDGTYLGLCAAWGMDPEKDPTQ